MTTATSQARSPQLELESALVCPHDRSPLRREGEGLRCAAGHDYPVVDGVPVLLRDDLTATIDTAAKSLHAARAPRSSEHHAHLFVETLGIAPHEKAGVLALAEAGAPVDPVVAYLVGATNGLAYASLIGTLSTYPIPESRLPPAHGARVLDVGCSWGRWCVAAARKGYRAVGIDPSLGAVLAARRMCAELGVKAAFCVGDARALPFADGAFDQTFSYSVLQHFARPDLERALGEMARVLRPGGGALVQMANGLGVRSLYHQARRRFREPEAFDVRYWRPSELRAIFEQQVGPAELGVDCYLGLGLQASDAWLARPRVRAAIAVSEGLKRVAEHVPALGALADSLYVTAHKL